MGNTASLIVTARAPSPARDFLGIVQMDAPVVTLALTVKEYVLVKMAVSATKTMEPVNAQMDSLAKFAVKRAVVRMMIPATKCLGNVKMVVSMDTMELIAKALVKIRWANIVANAHRKQ